MSKEKMPRKMKKRFKKLIKFYDERKQEYEKAKQEQTVGTLLGLLIIDKIIKMGICPDSISDIKVIKTPDNIQATVKLHGAMESAEVTVNVEE